MFLSKLGTDDTYGTTELAADTWYHVAATWSGGERKLYVNGTLGQTETGKEAITATTAALLIGNGAGAGEGLDGLIALPLVYNVALNSTQIATLASGGSVSGGLVLRHPLDEGTGTSVADTSGNSHTGTITGATWSADIPTELS